jgi:ABC-type bacteriocin/lantibiotic exporter with double-glycine peptidase domain
MANLNIKQNDSKDCGAACLASIGNHFKVNLPIARIRQFANTDKRGTNVLGIIEAAEKMGFNVKRVGMQFWRPNLNYFLNSLKKIFPMQLCKNHIFSKYVKTI